MCEVDGPVGRETSWCVQAESWTTMSWEVSSPEPCFRVESCRVALYFMNSISNELNLLQCVVLRVTFRSPFHRLSHPLRSPTGRSPTTLESQDHTPPIVSPFHCFSIVVGVPIGSSLPLSTNINSIDESRTVRSP